MSAVPFNLAALVNVPVCNARVPPEGPRCIPFNFDFTAKPSYFVDLTTVEQRNFLTIVQSLYIDNSSNAVPLTVVFNASNQIIIAPPQTQGYYSVLAPQPARFTVKCVGGSINTPLFVINVAITNAIWGAASGGTAVVAVADAILDATVVANNVQTRLVPFPITAVWGIQLTLAAVANQLYTVLHAIDATVPTTVSLLNFQNDPSNGAGTLIYMGDSALTTARYGNVLQPSGNGFRQIPGRSFDLTKLYVLPSIANLLFNVELEA